MRVSILLPYYNRKSYLISTLDSFVHFYRDLDLEIIIIDDGSVESERPNDLYDRYASNGLDIKIKNITKASMNPSRPYNIGARLATGDLLLLTSPETMHTSSLYDICDISRFQENDYWCLSVFCPTDITINNIMASSLSITDKLSQINKYRSMILEAPGGYGRASFANTVGSWYLHSQYRDTRRNFCTLIHKSMYSKIRGFDERFVGSGYDDDEFLQRLEDKVRITYFDEFLALHANHPPVYGSGDPISNRGIFDAIQNGSLPRWSNEDWGLI